MRIAGEQPKVIKSAAKRRFYYEPDSSGAQTFGQQLKEKIGCASAIRFPLLPPALINPLWMKGFRKQKDWLDEALDTFESIRPDPAALVSPVDSSVRSRLFEGTVNALMRSLADSSL